MIGCACHFEEKKYEFIQKSVQNAVEVRKLACYITHRTKKTGNGHTLNKTSCRRLLRIRFLEEKVNEYFKS